MHRQTRWEDFLEFSAVLLFLLLVNINLRHVVWRIDLTEEKRYTISDATKKLLGDLDDVVYVEVYLEGELNAGFRRLQKSIRETLEQFRVYAGGKLEYKFTDPSDQPNQAARNRFYQQLVSKGLPATTLYETIEGERKQKVLFPGAIISYGNKETAALLLKGNKTATPAEQLNQSVEGLEYELANAIRKLSLKDKKAIAFIEGHGELTQTETADITATLSELYIVDRINPSERPLNDYDVLIFAQPKGRFSELEKFKIDQYLMQGGKAMFLMDKVQMNLDSIAKGGTYAFGYDLNIEDMLFRYGARINVDLLQDLQSGPIEVYTGNVGNRPNIQRLKWPYYIYLNSFSKHPIVRNLDVVYGKFISSLDTIKADGITKTPLIFTSQYSRIKPMPNLIDLNELKEDLQEEKYDRSGLPVAYLLEGTFRSHYATRFPPREVGEVEVVRESVPTKMIVVSDGDIIRNEIDRETGQPQPIDFDPATRQQLSNRDFIINALSYLTDEDGLIATRAKQITLRPLDAIAVRDEKTLWQVINVALPVLGALLFGLVRFYIRKKKFESKAHEAPPVEEKVGL